MRACCCEERTLWIANAGDCELHVSDVAFKHPAKAWKLVNSPFPATLHPGASLAVAIRYHAIERYARARELVITSDDPQHAGPGAGGAGPDRLGRTMPRRLRPTVPRSGAAASLHAGAASAARMRTTTGIRQRVLWRSHADRR